MVAYAPVTIAAPPIEQPKYGLLDTIGISNAQSVDDPEQSSALAKVGLGVQYQSEFCGPARLFSPACQTLDLGDLSVSVDDASIATITSTGLPDGTYRIEWGDGAVTTGEPEQLSEPHQYAADGTYSVVVWGETVGAFGVVLITVTNGVPSGPFTDTTVQDAKLADDGIQTVIGTPVPVYHLFSCRVIGFEDVQREVEERAMRSLNLGASRALASDFQLQIATGATDITPSGTAVSLVNGLALLEQYAGTNYGGRPVIHMSRANATRLISLMAVYVVGDHLETALGTLVVADGGYGGLSLPSAPAAGAGWMYVTGAVNIWQGRTFIGHALENPYNNEVNALAERVYVPTYECIHAAVEVTETAS